MMYDILHDTCSSPEGTTIFTPLENRESLSTLVAGQIQQAIREKKFGTGERLPSESELCSQFGVSRTAVREALRILTAQGLISVVKGKGIFVRESFSDIVTDPMRLYLQLHLEQSYVMDIIKARQIIEPSIAASAALYHTKDDMKRLQMDIEEMKACMEGFSELALLDMQFHLNIAKASQNSIMPLILHPIHRLLPEIKSTVYATNEDARESALEWHGKILAAIVRRNSEGAFDAMTEHLQIAERHARKMLKTQNALSKAPLEKE